MSLSSYFRDPRFRGERTVLFTVIPLAILGATIVIVLLAVFRPGFSGRKSASPPSSKPILSASVPQPVAKVAQKTPESLIREAGEAFHSGDRETARKILAEIDLSRAGRSEGWELAGRLSAAAGDIEGARREYTAGLRAAPSARLHYWRAVLSRDAGDLPAALADLDKARALAQDDALVTNERFFLLLQMGRKDEVRAEITAFITANNPRELWLMGLAAVALENGETADAATLLGHARAALDSPTYFQLLDNPVISRHQSETAFLPFFLRNPESGQAPAK